jgi:uncharacterized protein with HEPN domain
MQPEAAGLLWDARKAAGLIADFVANRTWQDYESDAMLRSVVERQFQIIGDALNKLSRLDPATAAKIADLPRIVAFRNVLVHGYALIDDELVWELSTRRTPVLGTAVKLGVAFSVTARQDKKTRAAIDAIPEQAWTPIPYWLSTHEVSGADVAATTYTAFCGRDAIPVRLVVRRVRPTPGSQLALFTTWDYHAFVTNRPGDVLEVEADHRRHAGTDSWPTAPSWSSAPDRRGCRSPTSSGSPGTRSISPWARTTGLRGASAGATSVGGSASWACGTWKTPAADAEHVTIAVSGAHGGHTVDFRALAARGINLVG